MVLFAFLVLFGTSIDRFSRDRDSKAADNAGVPSAPQSALAYHPCKNLYRLVCHNRRRMASDPTGHVATEAEAEALAYRIYEDIIAKHPTWEREEVDVELAKQIYTPERRKQVIDTFTWVKHTIIRIIEEQPEHVFNESEKNKLESRIERVELELPPPATLYADEPDLFRKTDVYYERLNDGRLRLRVGGAHLLQSRSKYHLIFTLGHELGHSIDPCEIRNERWRFPAYERLSACFIKRKLVSARKTREECGSDDQLSETFADWLAVQVEAEALRDAAATYSKEEHYMAVVNSVRDLCEEDGPEYELDDTLHPTPKTRIDLIFGESPAIRNLLGCTPSEIERRYCGFI